ncbi:MAG: AAA family ATPase [Methylovulum miyakonense]|uniref:AAA family ATPase n=1 Tax=Methylovulum miyakonense TaxID=645578 RepID=UPI003BB4F9A5
MTNLNVLIGANGAGKSNFIGFFKLLVEMSNQNLQSYVQKQGSPDALLHFGRNTTEKLKGNLRFGIDSYTFQLIPTNDNRLIISDEMHGRWPSKPLPIDNVDYFRALIDGGEGFSNSEESKLLSYVANVPHILPEAIVTWRIYHFHDTSDKAKVKQRHATNDNLLLKPDAANLAAYLRMLFKDHNDHYQRIINTIRLVAPFFGNFVQRPGEPEYIELEWTQKGQPDTPFKAHVLSDGTLRFICLATLLLQPLELLPDTILIDEPELGLHPYAISVLADIFKQVAEDKQLIVSTQSVELVNHLSPEDIIVVDQEDGASVFKRFSSEELSGWLEEYAMGELWKSNVLGGRP